MKKLNLPYQIHLLRILAILCLLLSYLWIAPSQVHALSAGSQDKILDNEGQTYATAAVLADKRMVYYGPWRNDHKAGLLSSGQPSTEIGGDSARNEQTQPQTLALSLGEHLWSTGPFQTDSLSLSISKGEVPQAPGESNPSAPLQQGPTLELDIISSPWATVDHNGISPTGKQPGVFVVEAVITNTGSITATNVEVTLDYDDGLWVLVDGEDEVRIVDVATDAPSYVYWLARYPNQPTDIGKSHQYTVTVEAPNTSLVATSTVQTRSSQSTSNTKLSQASAEMVVGVAFTVTQVYAIGTNALDAVFSPVGNDDFDASAYRLVASEVHFSDENVPPAGGPTTVTDRLYFDTVPSWADTAEVVYTFLALLPANTYLCPYAAFDFNPGDNAKFDEYYCSEDARIPITGTLTLSQTKQVNSLTVEQGQLLTYTINYTNSGDKPLQYTWIWDDIPTTLASIETDSITPTPAVTTESRVAWNLGAISPAGQEGSTGTLTFAILVDGDGQDLEDGELLVNQALFGISPGGLPKRAALTDTVTTTVQAPMIALSKTDGQDTVEPGDALVYTLHITNSSNSMATFGLVITDELPAGVSYTSGTATPPETSPPGQTLVWNDQNVPADNVLVVMIPVTVDSDVLDGTILTNEATVMYKNASGQHTFATKTAADTTVVEAPVLTITKTAEDVNGGDLVVGDEILYTLQVTNTGSITAMGVTVTDDLPDQVTCQTVSGDSAPAGCTDPLVWSIPSLASDSTASLYITVTIKEGSEWQTITNTASVTGSNVLDPPDDPTPVCPDGSTPVGGVCTTTPEPRDTELSLTKTAEDVNGGYLVVGDAVLYTLQVTNTGTYTAYNVTVTDDLPDQVTCQAVSGDSPPFGGCDDPLVWSIPSLATDTTASLYITVTINEGGEGQTITNTGSVTGTNVPDPPEDPDPVCPDGSPPDPDTGECPTMPVQSADLAVSKGVDDASPDEGDTIVYTINVTNNGPHSTTGVVISDTLPGGVTYVTSTATQGSYNDGTGLWTVGTLHDSDVGTLTITATVDEDTAGQTITNVAEISASDQLDSDSNNNSDSVNIRSGGGGVYLPIILKSF
jgi:uncharacterized repeat protein (TIGR01451 family)